MKRQPVSLQTLAKSSKLQAELGIKVIICKRNFDATLPLGATLSDSGLARKNGWVCLAADESAIYADIKENNDGMSLLHASALEHHNIILTLLQEQ